MKLHGAIPTAKVIPPPTNNRVEALNHFLRRVTQLLPLGNVIHLLSHRLHGLLARPVVGHYFLGVPGLTLVKMKTKKVKTFPAHSHNAGFGGMKGQFQFVHDLLDLLQSFLGFSLGSADDHKVSGPREFHPRALSEPDMNLSAHPAPIIQP